MLTDLTIKFAAAGFAIGMIGHFIRYRYPRLATFCISLMIFSLSSWLLASTYELAIQGNAHILSRHYGTFAKADSPDGFRLSVWFHAILASVLFIAGLAGMIAAIVKREIHFERSYTHNETFKLKRLLVLLAIALSAAIAALVLHHLFGASFRTMQIVIGMGLLVMFISLFVYMNTLKPKRMTYQEQQDRIKRLSKLNQLQTDDRLSKGDRS